MRGWTTRDRNNYDRGRREGFEAAMLLRLGDIATLAPPEDGWYLHLSGADREAAVRCLAVRLGTTAAWIPIDDRALQVVTERPDP